MSKKGKYIGLESRIQYEILDTAIYDYLCNGNIDKEKCLSHIKQFTKGENRARKILKHITVLLSKNNKNLEFITKNLKEVDYYQINELDRKALILSLFCYSFPITFDILTILAQVFKVQEKVSKEVIVVKIGAIYGGNRSMHIAIGEILPFLIECDIIKREKKGIYSLSSKIIISNKFIAELLIYTDIKLSGSKSILFDDLNFRPWYSYFKISDQITINFNQLIKIKDSSVGKGYITL